MSTLIRIIVTSIISLLMLSCNFSMNLNEGVDGNKNVVTEDRNISNTFNAIKISQGLELQITQSKGVALRVEADENLQDLIMTKVENNVLSIYSTENIRRAASKKIILSLVDLSSIKATSGSDVSTTNTINSANLDVSATSGALITLDIETKKLDCNSTSGSLITITGKTQNLVASATSGSNIDAKNLNSEISNVKSTSGANISVNTSKELTARATSGGVIKYFGNPEKVDKSDSSAGSIKKQ
ncbi:DUF2807 domain-containing protein [Winogradskyella sp.]|uniref:head GIN domain-containing protein n=1 Tax=uncultured Winogradskyella sp. TaxID=395353 RepID=UPI0023754369|nr:DUF2807 domain-containing protein [Winogradskyella sp.]